MNASLARFFYAKKVLSSTLSGTKYALTAGMLSANNMSSFNASQMLDGTGVATNGGFIANGTTSGTGWLAIDFGTPVESGKFSVYNYNGTTTGTWKMQLSSDNSNWVDAGSNTIATLAQNVFNDFTWANAGGYRYLRCINTATSTGQGWWSEIQVYAYV